MRKSLCRLAMSATFVVASFCMSMAQEQEVVALIRSGEYEKALAAFDQAGGSDLDRAFIQALIYRQKGQIDKAIAQLRGILRARPELIQPRRLLVSLLTEKKEYEAAEYHLNQLLRFDEKPRNRAAYRSALRRISESKPYGLSASFAIVPSTNINRGTDNEIFSTGFGDFVIDEGGKETTGVGLALSFSAYRRVFLENGNRLQFNLKTSSIVYDQSEFNQVSVKGSAEYRAKAGRGFWSLKPELSRAYVGGEREYDTLALSFDRSLPLDRTRRVKLSFRAEQRDYATADYLDGARYEASAAIRTFLSPRLAVEGTLGLNVGEPEAARFQYDGVEIGGRVFRNWASGWQLAAGLSHEMRAYRGDFTGVDFPRDDQITSLTVSVFNSRWSIRGTAPTLACRFTMAKSNIAFYDYDVQECTIGFTKRF
jgi:tetratricopeptide (TPR) repeat protein